MSRIPRWARLWIGYSVSLALLVWIFHDLRPSELREATRHLLWAWFPAAILCDVLNYVAQGARWSLLLRPVGRVPVAQSTRAIYAGLFVNEVLPLRAGEVLRTYLISRKLSVDVRRTVPSVVVERMLDGIWLAIAMAAVAAFVPLPESLRRAGDVLGMLVLLATAIFLALVIRGRRQIPENKGATTAIAPTELAPAAEDTSRGFRSFLSRQVAGVQQIGLSRQFWGAFGLTAVMYLLQGAAFWLVLLGCRLSLTFWAGLAVFLIVHIGTVIPGAPGNVGSYQFFCVLGLALFGIAKAPAAAASIVVFVVLTLPLWAIGLWALRKTGLSLRGITTRFAPPGGWR